MQGNLDEIAENKIENPDVVGVRALNSFKDICRFKKLKQLLTQHNIQLPKLHFGKVQPNLTD